MTYKLEPGLSRIVSPVVVVLPDGDKKEYGSGADACADTFNYSYRVDEIQAVDNVIEIKLSEVDSLNSDETFF